MDRTGWPGLGRKCFFLCFSLILGDVKLHGKGLMLKFRIKFLTYCNYVYLTLAIKFSIWCDASIVGLSYTHSVQILESLFVQIKD